MGKAKITVIIVISLTLIALVYFYYRTQQTKAQTRLAESQVDLINATTASQEACDRSWQCSTSQIMTGVGSVIGGLFGS